MHDLASYPAVWGLAGGLIATLGPLNSAVTSARAAKTPVGPCLRDAGTALAVSALSAAVFEPWLAEWLHATKQQDMQAIAGVIGAVANEVGPRAIKYVSQNILLRFKIGGGRP